MSLDPKNGKKGVAEVAESALPVAANVTADPSLAEGLIDPALNQNEYEREVERIRKLRKPASGFTLKLAVPQRRGYKRHWFNDTPGRVEHKLSEGWANVKDSQGKPLRRVVGSGRNGTELYAFCLEIPSVIWEEEVAAFHKVAQARIDDIRNHPVRSPKGVAQKSDANKFYSPREDITSVMDDPVPSSAL